MELLKEYFVQWIGSNTIAILLLITAIRSPRLARLMFFLLFAWACWINYTIAQSNPVDYLSYAALTPFAFMQDFINGWFKENVSWVVTCISFGQGLIAIGMLLKGWLVRLACIGAIIFLLAIVSLGIGSGFPATVIAAAALYFILKKDDLNYLWKFN
ncbi:MAG: hypothetical protein KJO77_10390 [Bacteroidia bacterium]|nr:hypothetical protein [Bacteroidia bacterium]